MPLMKDKIKSLFTFIKDAWTGGIRGKIGFLLLIFAIFMFIRIFWGEVNVQTFIMNIWRLNASQEQLIQEQEKLQTLYRHIELLQSYSFDYVEELGLKYLNIGDPDIKVLKM